MIVSPLDA